MDWNSFLQGTLEHWVSELLIVAGGILFAWLKKINATAWLGPISYGVGGVTLMSVIVFTFTGRPILSRQAPTTTLENVETNIKSWVDEFNVSILKENDSSAIFEYVITLHNGTYVYVARMKDQPTYLQFIAKLTMSAQQKQILDGLSASQQKEISDEIVLEAARQRIGYTVNGLPVTVVVLDKAVPITDT